MRVLSTCLGIWMCRAAGLNLMVMDVEGTDGRERGEDQVRCCCGRRGGVRKR